MRNRFTGAMVAATIAAAAAVFSLTEMPISGQAPAPAGQGRAAGAGRGQPAPRRLRASGADWQGSRTSTASTRRSTAPTGISRTMRRRA